MKIGCFSIVLFSSFCFQAFCTSEIFLYISFVKNLDYFVYQDFSHYSEAIAAVSPEVQPVLIKANSIGDLKKKIEDRFKDSDEVITHFIFTSHGTSDETGLTLGYAKGEDADINLRFDKDSSWKEAKSIFSPICGRFTDSASIYFTGCNILQKSDTETSGKAAAAKRISLFIELLGVTEKAYFYGASTKNVFEKSLIKYAKNRPFRWAIAFISGTAAAAAFATELISYRYGMATFYGLIYSTIALLFIMNFEYERINLNLAGYIFRHDSKKLTGVEASIPEINKDFPTSASAFFQGSQVCNEIFSDNE